MKNIEKSALTRIISDIIKADNIIDISEINFLSSIKEKYKLKSENLIEAQKMDFSIAAHIMKNVDSDELTEILSDLKGLMISEGNGSPKEAYMVIALNLYLNPKFSYNCEIISTNIQNIAISRGNIIYTETEYDDETNRIIRENLRYIVNDFKLVGLDFVYIPDIVNAYNNMEQEHLMKFIHFLAPSLNSKEQGKIRNTLQTLTTEDFCHEFLIRKMELDQICDSDPSLLFQICHTDSKVIYLLIQLGPDVLKDLRDLVDMYKSIIKNSFQLVSSAGNNIDRFKYFGFYRSFFNLIAFPGQYIESRIIIDTYRKCILFSDLGECLTLPTKQLALYIFIIQQSICTNKKELNLDSCSEKTRLRNQNIFKKIYGYLSASECSDFKTGITPALAKIKKAISEIRFLDNCTAYIPERKDGTLKIRISSSKVFVKNSDGTILPITDSPRWNNL